MTAGLRRALRRRYRRLLYRTLGTRLQRAYDVASLPVLTLFLFLNPRIHPAYRMTWRRKARLAWRMWRTTRNVFTGTSYRAHLAIAVKVMEIPPSVEGVVVECGSVPRRLDGESVARLRHRRAARSSCTTRSRACRRPRQATSTRAQRRPAAFEGSWTWFASTCAASARWEAASSARAGSATHFPKHSEPIVACFLDVDYQASLHDCVLNLWPWLMPKGYVFIDEYVLGDYCALFWSERYWRTYFDATPPGLLGAGTGIGLGQYYTGPFDEWQWALSPAASPTRAGTCPGTGGTTRRIRARRAPAASTEDPGSSFGIMREAERQAAEAHARGPG